MSWANELYAVYDKALDLKFERAAITPIAHSKRSAQIEVTIDQFGEFSNAEPIDSSDDDYNSVIYPVTEKSSIRTSGAAPHAFSDELQYLAGDYFCFFSEQEKENTKFKEYIKQLEEWKNSDYSHSSVEILYSYLSRKSLVNDMIKSRVLTLNENGKVIETQMMKIPIQKCFVRFRILGGHGDERTWLDKTLYEKYVQYFISLHNQKALCYATGNCTYCTEKHPAVMGTLKLFSTQKETNEFKYTGRFYNADQAVSIGYDFSEKMHGALKWLIDRQAVSLGKNKSLIVWNSVLSKLPEICDASETIFAKSKDDFADLDMDFEPLPEIFTSYKTAIHKSVFGYKSDLEFEQKVMILMLEAANSNGRISVTMYSELYGSSFYDNICKWHTDTAWNRYTFEKRKDYIGSFALPMIAEYAYGTEQNGKMVCKPEIKGDIIARLVPCVTEGRKLPADVLRQLVNRTSRRTAYNKTWNTLLSIACGMIRKSMIERGVNQGMALDKECKSRSYLFGRLLAVAENAEKSTYQGDERPTNAERYFEKFSNSPAVTWAMIMQRLSPYFNRMSAGTKTYYQKIIDEIMDKFDRGDFNDNSKLQPEFLLAYSCQRKELYAKKHNDNSEEV